MNPLYTSELLKAWLRDLTPTAFAASPSPSSSGTPWSPPTAPDVLVTVGDRAFPAHRCVLRAHSGFFKAALSNSSDHHHGVSSYTQVGGRSSPSSPPSNGQSPPPNPSSPPPGRPTSVGVPHVTPEAFSPLLVFMYSGWLEINAASVYGVLLAAQLLHMPHALELCRAFLQGGPRAPSPPQPPPRLVKPIPSRRMPPLLGLPWAAPLAPWTPWLDPPSYPPPPPAPSLWTPFLPPRPPTPSPPLLPPPLPPPPPPQQSTSAPTPPLTQSSASPRPLPYSSPGRSSPGSIPSTRPIRDPQPSDTGGVIIDVANCDGPVRFQRVLNPNYGLGLNLGALLGDKETAEADVPSAAALNDDSNTGSLPSSRGDVADKEPSSASPAPVPPPYRCLFCNHTFKSHYCYQKHKRRHINPIPLDLERLGAQIAAAATAESSEIPGAPEGAGESTEGKRDVAQDDVQSEMGNSSRDSGRQSSVTQPLSTKRQLELNVQYFPCKTCGSKFPSYYFVHKHRRICHGIDSEGDDPRGDSSTTS